MHPRKVGLDCLVIAESPGKTEDEKGVQLIGSAGQKLREKLARYDLDLDKDFWKINAINCRPPNNRTPTKKEISCCWDRVKEVIDELKPECIWLLGGVAIESFLNNMYKGRFYNTSVGTWRGFCIPDRKINA